MSSTVEKLRRHESKFPYGLFGVVVSVIIGLGGILFTLLYKPSPQLDIEILSNFNVLDVKESLGNLDVIYKGNSLNESNKSLSVIKLKIVNNGDDNIRISSYDEKAIAGFTLTKGIIPEAPTVINSTTSYNLAKLPLTQTTSTRIELPKVIINSGDYYEVKLVALHDKDEKPDISAFGVLEGMDKIRIIHNPDLDNERSFLSRLFYDNWKINLSRFVIFGFVFFLMFISSAISFLLLKEKFDERKMAKLAKNFYHCTFNSSPITEEQLINGSKYYADSSSNMKNFYLALKLDTSLRSAARFESKYGVVSSRFGLLTTNDGQSSIDEAVALYLIDFYEYLERNNVVDLSNLEDRKANIQTSETIIQPPAVG